MRNFRLLVEYDGTDFHGWQKQPQLRTVQGSLEEAVGDIFGKPVPVNGAGRTDAGVHATGQVANFVMDTHMTAEQVGRALSSKLPEDIQVYKVEDVDMNFHARFSATTRRYAYYLRTEPTAIWRRFAYVVTTPLDVDAMSDAANRIVGEHDFTSFTPSRSNDVPTLCNILKSEVAREDDFITFEGEADHFLQHMVRVLVGTLVEIGRGRLPAERIDEILVKRNRGAAGPTIPPNGLFLVRVSYDD